MDFEVIIVGGGPAGLSAALVLGRARRRVALYDAGRPRNAWSRTMHNVISRDGMNPGAFLDAARADVDRYPSVTRIAGEIVSARRTVDGFVVATADGAARRCRKLLLATGVVDHLPDIPGILAFYGVSIHHCPYCDGYEHGDRPIIVVGKSTKCAGMALMMTRWSSDVTFVAADPSEVAATDLDLLRKANIAVLATRITALEGNDGQLDAVRLADGSRRPCRAIFFNTGQHQRSPLIAELGVEMGPKGGALTGHREDTRIPGLFVAGDASRDVQFVIVAAAEGATAAVAIDKELMVEDGLLTPEK